MLKLIRWGFVYLLVINSFSGISGNMYEKNLKEHLLHNYRSDSLPIINRTTVDIKLGIALRSFNDVNQMDGTLTTNVWLRHWWYDEYLTWNPIDWNNISSIVLFTDGDMGENIWVPDIYLYNTAENPLSELNYGRVKIYNDGYILWSRPGMIKSTCTFDLTSFPYDEQYCNMKFGSWSYHGDEVNLDPGTPAIDVSELQDNQAWDLVNYSYGKNVKYYSCCPEPYPDITFNITLRRRPGYYNTNILLPAFATSSLMLISLVLPSESGERISFVTTVMLSIIVFLLILSENLPKSDTEPLLSRMLIGLTFFSLIVVFITVMLSAMRNYKNNKFGRLLKYLFNKENKCLTGTKSDSDSDSNGNSNGNSNMERPDDILDAENSMFRNRSYTNSILRHRTSTGRPEQVDVQNQNNCEEECEEYANKIEGYFIFIFTLVFLMYCIIMFGEKPSYPDPIAKINI
jgi:nicotinic acetylcholine receptor